MQIVECYNCGISIFRGTIATSNQRPIPHRFYGVVVLVKELRGEHVGSHLRYLIERYTYISFYKDKVLGMK